MSFEEAVAEVRRLAKQFGCPADLFPEDVNGPHDAVILWTNQKVRALLAQLPEAEREELLSRFPHLREPPPFG